MQKMGALGAKFGRYAPNFTGRSTPEESVNAMLPLIKAASIEKGYGGSFISHLGNKQWL